MWPSTFIHLLSKVFLDVPVQTTRHWWTLFWPICKILEWRKHCQVSYYCFHLIAEVKSFDHFLGMQKAFGYKEMIPNQKTKYGNVFLCIFAFRIWASFAFFFQMDDALGTFLHFFKLSTLVHFKKAKAYIVVFHL